MNHYYLLMGAIALIWVRTVFAGVKPPALTDKTANYLTADKPDDRPVSHLIVFNDQLVIGTDEGVYLKRYDGSYQKTLPHGMWQWDRGEGNSFIVAGAYLYAKINRYHRSATRGHPQLWRSADGVEWEKYLDPCPQLVAMDVSNHQIWHARLRSRYTSSVYVQAMGTSAKQHVDDPLLHDITAMAIQPETGTLFFAAKGRLIASFDQGQTFEDISHRLKQGIAYNQVQFEVNRHTIVVGVNQHYVFISRDGGSTFQEFGSKVAPDSFSGYRLCGLQGDTLLLNRGSRKPEVMDVQTGKCRRIYLPETYRYAAFVMYQGMFYGATAPPKQDILKAFLRQKQDVAGYERAMSPLLKTAIDPPALCQWLLRAEKPEEVIPFGSNSYGLVLDAESDSLWLNRRGLQIVHHPSGDPVAANTSFSGDLFTQGVVKGDWFMRQEEWLVARNSPGAKPHYRYMRSQNRGLTWQTMDAHFMEGAKVIYDDSLNLAYVIGKVHIGRIDLLSGNNLRSDAQLFDGEIVQVEVDRFSRVWVRTTYSLYVSTPSGFRRCPLPRKALLQSLAVLDEAVCITMADSLYIADTDVTEWESVPLPDPCQGEAPFPVRMVGGSQGKVVLQEQITGQLLVYDPHTQETIHYAFPRDNGVIREVHVSQNRMLVQTTGLPLVRVEGKVYTPPHLFIYSFNH